jgi:ribosomal protein S18 acetylase RimI-like enzyme
MGLGRAVLLASLANLRDWGAEVVRLVTVSNNLPAIGLYEAASFNRSTTFEPAVYKMVIAGS